MARRKGTTPLRAEPLRAEPVRAEPKEASGGDSKRAELRPISVDDAARPVTLGVVISLGTIVVSMIAYIFVQLQRVDSDLTRLQAKAEALEQGEHDRQSELKAVVKDARDLLLRIALIEDREERKPATVASPDLGTAKELDGLQKPRPQRANK